MYYHRYVTPYIGLRFRAISIELLPLDGMVMRLERRFTTLIVVPPILTSI